MYSARRDRILGGHERMRRFCWSWGGGDDRVNFRFGEDALGLFGGGEDAIDAFVGGRDAALFEPVNHVGAAAERADFDDLLEAEKMRGHAAVDGVG